MLRFRFFCSVCVLLGLLGGGCPQTLLPSSGSTGPDTNTGSTGTSAGSSSSSTAGDSAGSQGGSDTLANEFPGCSAAPEAQTWRDEIIRLVNVEREREGLQAVVRNAVLEEQATQYACEMIYYDFFDHVNPVTGSHLRDRAEEFGYEYSIIGENLAAGQPTPARAMSDWMNSPGHRENLLKPEFTELGVGVRLGGDLQTYWVQEFGTPYNP